MTVSVRIALEKVGGIRRLKRKCDVSNDVLQKSVLHKPVAVRTNDDLIGLMPRKYAKILTYKELIKRNDELRLALEISKYELKLSREITFILWQKLQKWRK
jgi:hypothetical protein